MDDVHVGIRDVLQVPRKYLDLPLVVVDLAPQPVVLVLAGQLLPLEAAQNVSDPSGGFGQHRPARDAQSQFAHICKFVEVPFELN